MRNVDLDCPTCGNKLPSHFGKSRKKAYRKCGNCYSIWSVDITITKDGLEVSYSPLSRLSK